MNPYLKTIILNVVIILLQGCLILEIERYWCLLKGKQSQSAQKIMQFIRMPYYTIRNAKTIKTLSLTITPLLCGIVTTGIIPLLNLVRRTDIALAFPGGYIATFLMGFFGMYMVIGVASIQVALAKTKPGIQLTGILLLVAVALLVSVTYWQWSAILARG